MRSLIGMMLYGYLAFVFTPQNTPHPNRPLNGSQVPNLCGKGWTLVTIIETTSPPKDSKTTKYVKMSDDGGIQRYEVCQLDKK